MLVKRKSQVCIYSSIPWIRDHDLGYDGKPNIGLSFNHPNELASIKFFELNFFNRGFILYHQLTPLLMRIKTRLYLSILSLLGWSVES